VPASIVVLSIVLAVAFVAAALQKLTGRPSQRQAADRFAIPFERYRAIGVLELAGAAGVLVGFAWTALGAAAAIGLTLLTVGALFTHVRVKDPPAKMRPALLLGTLSAVIAVLYLAHL
jgi:uncharacterized membrane protein YphA (DoxX/SURF4 family)